MKSTKVLILLWVLMMPLLMMAQQPEQDSVASDAPVMVVDDGIASFPGGIEALFSWLGQNMIYPDAAREDSVEGVVYLQFVVEADGSLTNFSIQRGVHPLLDSTVVEVMRKSPLWIPKKVDNKPVRSAFILPVKFALDAASPQNEDQKKKERKR